nr:hypothetical protein BaRGS_001038 [Batillaria attramentaria]
MSSRVSWAVLQTERKRKTNKTTSPKDDTKESEDTPRVEEVDLQNSPLSFAPVVVKVPTGQKTVKPSVAVQPTPFTPPKTNTSDSGHVYMNQPQQTPASNEHPAGSPPVAARTTEHHEMESDAASVDAFHVYQNEDDVYASFKATRPELDNVQRYLVDRLASGELRATFQEKTTHIVMLTNVKENGKNKCFEYWPGKKKSENYGPVKVTGLGEDHRASFIVRTFKLKLSGEQFLFLHKALLEAYTARDTFKSVGEFASSFPQPVSILNPDTGIDKEFKTFWQERGTILTQLPLPNTLIDFWRMVYGDGVKTIVSLASKDEEAQVTVTSQIGDNITSYTVQLEKEVN